MLRVMMSGDAVGGVWRYSLDLARGFAEAGIEPVLAVMGPSPSSDQMTEATEIAGLRIIDTGLPLDWTATDPDALREASAALAGLARRLEAASVHLHTPALAAEAPWTAPVVAVAHSCVGTWWQAVRGGELPEDLAWRAAATGRGLAEADVAIAPTRAFAMALSRLYRPGRLISVIHNGADPVSIPPHPRDREVLAAGRLWDDGKNFAALDRVAARLDAPILAAGPLKGPTGEQFEPKNLRALGRLPARHLADCMASATVFVAPARYEPFGLAVLEAAHAGMALALADIPTFRELWDGVAVFFHPDDDEGLQEALTRLLDAPKPFGARATVRARMYQRAEMVAATLRAHASVQSAYVS